MTGSAARAIASESLFQPGEQLLDGKWRRCRINIFERWESQAARETFRSSGADKGQRAAMLTDYAQQELQHGPCHDR
jgi:hypothetical protein